MRELAGRTAFITGGASGIGLGMARAFVEAGMKVAIADIRQDALDAALESLAGQGAEVRGIRLDVTDRQAWVRAADEAEAALGPVQLLCSNAGVNFMGAAQDATFQDWDFCLGVNLGGAINAVRTFVPRMLAHGSGGHVVITSSVAGLFTGRGQGVYATTKYALTGLAESLRADLTGQGVGVSVLCPGPVKSDLFESTVAVRPAALAESGSRPVVMSGQSREETPIFATAMTGDEVGRRVAAGILRDDLYIMTHTEIGGILDARAAALKAALPDEPINQARTDAAQGLLNPALYEEQIAKPAP